MANRYTISFKNEINQDVVVVLTPKGGFDATQQLIAVDNTFRISADFNDDQKIQVGIISKVFDFAYMYDPENPVPIETFVSTDYDAWKVQIFIDGSTRPYFSGFLSIEDNNQRILDRREPIFLRATDGFSQLRAIDYQVPEDLPNQEEKKSILFLIVQAIAPIGLTEIKVRTIYNITGVGMPGRNTNADYDPLENIYIEPALFTGNNCYEALSSILNGLGCRIFQEDGYIWIDCLMDRLLAVGFSYSEYEIPGTLTDGFYDYTLTDSFFNIDYACQIGSGKLVRPINAEARKYLKLPSKFTKITYQYRRPTEWFCNQSFNKFETLIEEVGNTSKWELECWQHGRIVFASGILNPEEPNENTYVFREIDPSTEEESARYAVLESENPTVNGYGALYAPYFEIGAKDRLTISIDVNYENNPTQENVSIGFILLIADNGSLYYLGYDPTSSGSIPNPESHTWILTDALGISNRRPFAMPADDEWSTGTVISPPCPANGKIQIILIEGPEDTTNGDTYFRNLSIEIRSSITDNNIFIDGETHTSSELNTSPINTEKEVIFGDLPNYKRYIRGGLFYPPSQYPDLREPWPRIWSYYGQFVSLRAFNKLMSGMYQSHQRKVLYKVESSLKGLIFTVGTNTYPIGFLPRYRWTELNPNIEFMLTGAFEIDLNKGHWRGVFVQTMENYQVDEFSDSTNYEFKYLTS